MASSCRPPHSPLRPFPEGAPDPTTRDTDHPKKKAEEAEKFLEDGEVREQGSPQELMAKPDGAYRTFVELQTTSEG